jgi:hypothetical protein
MLLTLSIFFCQQSTMISDKGDTCLLRSCLRFGRVKKYEVYVTQYSIYKAKGNVRTFELSMPIEYVSLMNSLYPSSRCSLWYY